MITTDDRVKFLVPPYLHPDETADMDLDVPGDHDVLTIAKDTPSFIARSQAKWYGVQNAL